MRFVTIGIVAVVAAACGGTARVRFECAHGEPLCEKRPLAGGLDIDRVAVYQGVETWVMDAGQGLVPDNAPLVAGRDALFRIFVQSRSDWEGAAEVTAKVELFDDERFQEAVELTQELDGSSAESDLQTTFNVLVPGRLVSDALSWRVRLLDGPPGLDAGDAEWPEGGELATLEALPGAELLRIGLVPVEYNADGSGRLPDTSDTMIEMYRSWMYRIYPTAKVEIEVLEPMATNQKVSANGSGWSELLSEVGALRTSYGVDDDVYLYGAFSPDESFSTFCAGGCVTGLSNLAASASDSWSRSSIGLGYTDETLAETMVHEVGHAHGRYHVDCGGASGTDPDYPYDGSSIGVRGYDLVGESLKEADQYADFMGYCWPVWTSDYTYDALFERIVGVNALATGSLEGRVAPADYQSVWVHSDGHLTWGEARTSEYEPGGERRRIDLVGARHTEQVEAWFSPFDHLPGGLLVYRAPDWPVQAVEIRGRNLPVIP